VETAPVERSVNMEKHYTHKNICSTERERERERERDRERERESQSTFVFSIAGDRSGRQIRRRQNAGEGRWRVADRREREATERDRDDRHGASGRERERGAAVSDERSRHIRPERERERGA
jgi:hypothetical protein